MKWKTLNSGNVGQDKVFLNKFKQNLIFKQKVKKHICIKKYIVIKNNPKIGMIQI